MLILLTGPPGVGKTTLLKKVVSRLSSTIRLKGFFTEELRDRNGNREGFDVVSVNGRRAVLARVGGNSSGPSVGKYTADIRSFESIAIEALADQSTSSEPSNQPTLYVLDEIGKMELFSNPFVASVRRIASSSTVLFGTVAQAGGGLIEEVKRSPNTRLHTVSVANRNQLIEPLVAEIQKALGVDGRRLVLGSASQSRQRILRDMGLQFDVLPAHIDEKAIRMHVPEQLVMALAVAKADALREQLAGRRDVILITADQVVVCNGRILEKPESKEEALGFINGYSLSPARTVGAIVVTDMSTGAVESSLDTAEIYFRPIPPHVVHALIDAGNIYYCAGGLMIEDPLIAPYIESIYGNMSSVMGMGQHVLSSLLAKVRYSVPAPQPAAPQ